MQAEHDPRVAGDPAAIAAVAAGGHGDPFAVLGPHDDGAGPVVRAFLPGARRVEVLARDGSGALAVLELVHPAGVFAGRIDRAVPYLLRIDWPGGSQETEDPYAFGLLLGALDLHLFSEGTHHELGRVFGARPLVVEGVEGVRFAVWAPNASRVSVVGGFNGWDGRRHPMRLRRESGVWELFVPRLSPGERYKFEIRDRSGGVLPLKSDPCGAWFEVPPATAAIVWRDPAPDTHGAARAALRAGRNDPSAPIAVYEAHLGSWLGPDVGDGGALGWEGLADRLVPYVADMGFTHLELLPVTEHPFGGSWGYQPLGLFAPTARFGPPEGFDRFIDRCDQAGIGVLLDWVPAHFPTDPHGLGRFDGTALYEHADPREGFHRDWNSLIYNFGRDEVRGFLVASALHWLDRFRIDGLRVDAVASMLYRDYSRPAGEWIPNRYGGRENLEALGFIRALNAAVAARHPGAAVVAEESTAWPGVTRPIAEDGLGFAYKWNMGWMHDTLRYMSLDPVHRRHHHDDMTFGTVYAFSERFVLPLSHDEVVHGKGSLLGKMPGDRWQRFANLRAYFGFMYGHPGKKLLFMGGEFAQEREWNHDAGLDWQLLDDPAHRGVQRLVRDLNAVYRREAALHRLDTDPAGFRWVVGDDRANSVFAFLRSAGTGADGGRVALVVANFTPVPRPGYRIGVPRPGRWREALNTDATDYGGGGIGNGGGVIAEDVGAHGEHWSLVLTLPPLATLILLPE